jgi:signal transduction histidine kinase
MKSLTENFQRLTDTKAARENIDVNEVIRRAELLLRPLARKERVTVSFHLSPNLPSVSGYSAWLQQVFLNLMLNAVQQMALKDDKHRLLEVRTACAHSDKGRLQIRFTDTGPGIHKRLWEQIFALGFTTRPGGNGLGLYLVRSLLESMRGMVKVEESIIPCGTTFLVELPVSETKEV